MNDQEIIANNIMGELLKKSDDELSELFFETADELIREANDDEEKSTNSVSNDSEQHEQYVISSIQDFFKVPEDRITDCLEEFASFLTVARGMKKLINTVGDASNDINIGAFTWTDDGKKEGNINIIQSDSK